MKKDDLVKAVGLASEEYIEEAAPGTGLKKGMKKAAVWIPLAAAVCVLGVVGWTMRDSLFMAKSSMTADMPEAAAETIAPADGAVMEEAVEEAAFEEDGAADDTFAAAANSMNGAAEAMVDDAGAEALAEAAGEEVKAAEPAMTEAMSGEAVPENMMAVTMAETAAAEAPEPTLTAETDIETESDEEIPIRVIDYEDGLWIETAEVPEGSFTFPYEALLYIQADPSVYRKIRVSENNGGAEIFVSPQSADSDRAVWILAAYPDEAAMADASLQLVFYDENNKKTKKTFEPGSIGMQDSLTAELSSALERILNMHLAE